MSWHWDAPISMLNFSILTVILLLQCIQNGAAIKCFVCDSSDNPSCADLKSNSSIVAEECTLDKMRTINTWLFELNRFAYFNTGTRNNPVMNCQKVVARDPYTRKMVTARFCQLDTADSDACQILGNKLEWPPELAHNANLDKDKDEENKKKYVERKGKNAADNTDMQLHCSICDKDSCNGSQNVNQLSRSGLGSIFLTTLIAIMIRLHDTAW